jgi:hypothetical protein
MDASFSFFVSLLIRFPPSTILALGLRLSPRILSLQDQALTMSTMIQRTPRSKSMPAELPVDDSVDIQPFHVPDLTVKDLLSTIPYVELLTRYSATNVGLNRPAVLTASNGAFFARSLTCEFDLVFKEE